MKSTRPVVAAFGWAVSLASAGALAGCGSDGSSGSSPSATGEPAASVVPSDPPAGADRCLVRLHGKGGAGGPTVVTDGVAELRPTGNADGWDARQWLYFPDDRYAEAVAIVAGAVDAAGCATVVIDGFSNGASFAASLYCRGEDLDGRVRGVVIDDPVPDRSTEECTPAAGVDAVLYWTGGLDAQATPGADCGPLDWTCEGDSMVGIDAYAAGAGLPIAASPFTDHEWYLDAPEIDAWLTG